MEDYFTIQRGTHQIGGCCTEIWVNGKRILIDFGAELNKDEEEKALNDEELTKKVAGGKIDGVLFSHYHGDHIGLYKSLDKNIPCYIGKTAREILKIVTPYIDFYSEIKGIDRINNMNTYEPGEELKIVPGMKIIPLYVDHSALDAYMFYIEACGKKILFTGDFREHGIVGEMDRLWRVLEKYVPKNIDILITEGTMASRIYEAKENIVKTEKELGKKAGELFAKKKYNFVIVSSTNLDSIMEFYHNTPKGQMFVCDYYQAMVMLTAMKHMEQFKMYRASKNHRQIYVLDNKSVTDERWEQIKDLGSELKEPLEICKTTGNELHSKGFVMLVRKNLKPENPSVFDKMMNSFGKYKESQIIYSMWCGYLEGGHKDDLLLRFIGDREVIRLHTSGHAYVSTIKTLIDMVSPKVIIPMHTECADEFDKIDELKEYANRIKVLKDGDKYEL